jgi:heptosyltransferase-1
LKKILLLKPSSLGDVIHALPVLRSLKSHWPASEIYWWLDINLVPLLRDDPDLAGIFPFQRQRWAKPPHWREMAASIAEIRAHHFDVAIDLQGLARSAVVAWLSNSSLTIGLDNLREGSREGARAFYDLTPPRAAPGLHSVDRYLAVLPLLGVPTRENFSWLPPRPKAAESVQRQAAEAGGKSAWIIFIPGGRWDNKRWPVNHFCEMARRAGEWGDFKIAILGAKNERQLGDSIAAAAPGRCLNLAGSTTLGEMIEWIRFSRLVLTNDTGPMHVAAALRRPVVALFGPTDAASTGPYRQLQNVLQITSLPCVPCMKSECFYHDKLACLRDLKPDVVFERVRALLQT